MALRLMCRGRVWKTSELEDFWVTAFSIALISAARAWAKVEAVEEKERVTAHKSWMYTAFSGGFQKEDRFEIPPVPQAPCQVNTDGGYSCANNTVWLFFLK